MQYRFDFIYLIGAALFFYTGFHQFYLSRNVDQLERTGKITRDAAARIRRKPMRLIGCAGLFAGAGMLLAAFVRF
jgi:hypothetical protein